MFENKRVWIDPPSGWIYGFPKIYDPRIDMPNVYEWIIQNGYPRNVAESYKNHFNYRVWNVDENAAIKRE